ncbi:hypothetical protein C0068_12165 [Zhongshania marina]|uniref:Uncharacterized protein n=1 Tax=Zhongshania marina TaxID=2304603 RepID=A0A2S4HEZ4_9GAMM|nr:hypothetical protein C0068_12165 [Marortus luteolus]
MGIAQKVKSITNWQIHRLKPLFYTHGNGLKQKPCNVNAVLFSEINLRTLTVVFISANYKIDKVIL